MPKNQPVGRKIVGFSLPPSLVVDVKSEASRRGITLRKLFEEMWDIYKSTTRK